MSETPYDEHFVSWFRAVTPYINAFRGKTFVIAFGGKAVASEFAKTLAYDVNLLVSLGIRLVLVHGARPQIEEELREKNLESKYHRGYRVTDAEALDCVLDAVGSVYLEIEAMLSQGLPNTPMANSRIRVIGGNFITGQPIGVLDGIDMHYAGKVRKVRRRRHQRAARPRQHRAAQLRGAIARPVKSSTCRWRRLPRQWPLRSGPTS